MCPQGARGEPAARAAVPAGRRGGASGPRRQRRRPGQWAEAGPAGRQSAGQTSLQPGWLQEVGCGAAPGQEVSVCACVCVWGCVGGCGGVCVCAVTSCFTEAEETHSHFILSFVNNLSLC